ncbi:unnamed protein product [Plutella xylostella]|uniref:(diamondback moth) hypothetical protein n=1 Tax=Plutella xylostella TaxID=51655 RepID=A0A8S4FPE2_PLUXY|nr:unnamed protein product [Plutella xylostella]
MNIAFEKGFADLATTSLKPLFREQAMQRETSNFHVQITFDEKESISGMQQLKSSVQKGIRARLLELYPTLENYVDQVLPKKDTFRIVKWCVVFLECL